MSVINKMLRDLDSRHVMRMPGRKAIAGQADVTVGTVALGARGAAQSAQPAQSRRWMVLSGVLLVILAGVLAGWLGLGQVVRAPAVSSVVLPQFVANAEPKSVAAPSSTAVATHTAPVASALVVAAPTVSVAAVQPRLVSVSAVASAAVLPLASAAKIAASAHGLAIRPAQTVSRPTSVPTQPTVPNAKPASPSVTDVLAQAQAQWSQSDQVGALALVQAAIAHLEQSPGADNAALAALAREHTRMSLAMGYPQAALANLVRLETQLSAVADIWALRGNINQRLGQHPRAVQAYLAALALRANEPRWMLGAAVSLAIQGQTGSAAEWAEKARLAGGLRPDVANYLRQLGVDIRAD